MTSFPSRGAGSNASTSLGNPLRGGAQTTGDRSPPQPAGAGKKGTCLGPPTGRAPSKRAGQEREANGGTNAAPPADRRHEGRDARGAPCPRSDSGVDAGFIRVDASRHTVVGGRVVSVQLIRRLAPMLAVLVTASIVTAVILMEQIQPAVPASQLTGNCSPRTAPTPTEVVLGSNGQITFSCNSSSPATSPAFTTSAEVRATPTITGLVPPYNASRTYIYDADGSPNTGFCSSRAGNQKIESGVEETIPANGWNYCAEYENVGPEGLPEFKVTWSA